MSWMPFLKPDRKAGELFEINLDQLPDEKMNGRPSDQFPSIIQLHELEGLTGVDIRILVVQAKEVPDTVCPGLSPEVKEAIPRAGDWLINEIGRE